MAGFASSGDDDVISNINVTPMVDVTLVLLIIFMITAPVLYQSAIKVQLPKAKSGQESRKSPLSFTLSKTGELAMDREKIEWSQIAPRLTALGATLSEETAVISADQQTPYETVIRLMDTLQQSGLTRFALNVEAPPAH